MDCHQLSDALQCEITDSSNSKTACPYSHLSMPQKASDSIEDLFVVDMKEMDSEKPPCELVSKRNLPNKVKVPAGRGLPKTGLLMNVLGMVFMNGNCASEEETWAFLNAMRVFPGGNSALFPDFLSRLLPAVPDHSDIMSVGHSSKKHHRAQNEPQSCGNAWATAAEEESPPSFSTQHEGISCPGSYEASSGQNEHDAVSSATPPFTGVSVVDDFKTRTASLELFLLTKYKLKQLIMKEDLLRIVGEKYEDRFSEMLKKASDQIETAYALYINEVDSSNYSYALVSKLKLPNNGRVRPGRGLPKTGFLMHILGMIFMNGNCVSEEKIWKELRLKRVYAGRKHFIFGEPRKLLTDFVRLKYLECRQVPHSDPPCSEFLWGPRAHLETSKMEVLEFCAKANSTHPSDYPCCYEEALREEKERARAREAAGAATIAQVTAAFRAMASTTFLPVEESKAFCPSDQNI
ncbi:melanoma-associated antigen B5-like [Myotis lucifugus]|uniref:melanoma-associated antigen B5-like n=1 Tax=Myotis lucifugus TaxID=59463 RepID=UPI0006D73608|nr:melanoma-associated antigen B5-like [Myotis lucifugus]